jgi:hypothetical protein
LLGPRAAVRFSPPGTCLRVGTEAEDGVVRIHIVDEGLHTSIGMPLLPVEYEALYRHDPSYPWAPID